MLQPQAAYYLSSFPSQCHQLYLTLPWHPQVDVVRPVLPLLALALTVILCAVPVAQVADVLRASGLAACTPVILLHSFGYLLGYGLPKLLGFNEKTSRTGDWHAVLL